MMNLDVNKVVDKLTLRIAELERENVMLKVMNEQLNDSLKTEETSE